MDIHYITVDYFLPFTDPTYRASVVSRDLYREDPETSDKDVYVLEMPFRLTLKADIIWWFVRLEKAVSRALGNETKEYIWRYIRDPVDGEAFINLKDERIRKALKSNTRQFVNAITHDTFMLGELVSAKDPLETLADFRKWVVEDATKFKCLNLVDALINWKFQWDSSESTNGYADASILSQFMTSHTFENDVLLCIRRSHKVSWFQLMNAVTALLKGRKNEVLDVFDNCFHYPQKEKPVYDVLSVFRDEAYSIFLAAQPPITPGIKAEYSSARVSKRNDGNRFKKRGKFRGRGGYRW